MWGKSQPVTHSSLPWRAVSNKSIQGSPQQQSHPNPPGLRRRCGRKADAEGEEAPLRPEPPQGGEQGGGAGVRPGLHLGLGGRRAESAREDSLRAPGAFKQLQMMALSFLP